MGCPWCKDALHFLRSHNVQFEEKDVLINPKYFDELVAKSGQSKAPTLDVDGELLKDTDAKEIEAFLRKKGILNG